MTLSSEPAAAGRFTFPGTNITVNRLGFGAMQLAGPRAFGPPADPDEAVAVLREAVALGVDHIDTSDFYGPASTNQIIRQALSPYPAELTIITKIGAARDAKGGWRFSLSPDFLRTSVEDNLRHLGMESLKIVYLRASGPKDAIAPAMEEMCRIQAAGLIRHIGLSNVTAKQISEARAIGPVVAVQNMYNFATRRDDPLIDALAADGIAYVPFYPMGGPRPFSAPELEQRARDTGTSVRQCALAWLLARSPNILLIPGTSCRVHLRENQLSQAEAWRAG